MSLLLAGLIVVGVMVWWHFLTRPVKVKAAKKTPRIVKNPPAKPPQKSEQDANQGGGFYNSGSVVRYGRKKTPPQTPPQTPTAEGLAFRRDRELAGVKMTRLDQLTRSREASERLVASVKRRHPDQPLAWCVDKAISDLERDRNR